MDKENNTPGYISVETTREAISPYADIFEEFARIQKMKIVKNNPATQARITNQEQKLNDLQNPPVTVQSVGTMLESYSYSVAANDSSFAARVFLDERNAA